MTASTVWNGSLPAGTASVGTGSRSDGLLFTISSAAGSPTLTEVAFYVPSAETTLTGSSYSAQVWTTTTGTTGTLVTSSAGSGTFTAGAWNWITLASPVALSTGVNYVAAVTSPDMIQFLHNYWGAGDPGQGGMTSGPIVVPDATTAPGGNQQGNAGGSAFPGSSTASWFGIDVMVVTSSGGGATVAGVTATMTGAAAAGSVSAGATVAGPVASSLMSAPAGSVPHSATVAGPVATSLMSAPAGSAGTAVVAQQGTASIFNALSATAATATALSATATIANTI